MSYLTYTEKHWVIDIEGDLIPSTKVYCLVGINLFSKEVVALSDPKEIKEWVDARVAEGCFFVGHNIIGYDAPTLNRILGTKIPISKLVDTFLLSMLYSPALSGGHSLESYGQRLKFPKLEFKDFSRFTPEMLEYCKRDTNLCLQVYLALAYRMKKEGFTELGCELEHWSWFFVKQQQKNGFAFNISEAHALLAKIRQEEEELKEKIYEYWPPKLEVVATYGRPTKKDGSPSANFIRHSEQFERVEILADGKQYNCYDRVAFNIGSPSQRVAKLLELGWKPREYTPKTDKGGGGNPKVTSEGRLVESLVEFVEKSGREEVKLIASWIELNSRGNMISNWIDNYNDDTGCIHGDLWYANTLRYRHSNPNTANIPAVRLGESGEPVMGREGAYTYEARGLWTCRGDDRVLVGVDAKGIQLRILAHYLNNSKFTEAILSSDPHAANQQMWGLSTRALAKTIVYATLMGAGDAKVASEAKLSLKEAKEAKGLFFQMVPELPELIKRLKGELKKTGRITLCSGNRISVSSDHMVIPYLLQGDESQIMKKAVIEAHKEIRRRRLDVLKCGDIHDEHQYDTLRLHSEEFAKDVLPTVFRRAGEFFSFRVPIDCDAKIGLTWAETH
jgi:DNA polymerase-1